MVSRRHASFAAKLATDEYSYRREQGAHSARGFRNRLSSSWAGHGALYWDLPPNLVGEGAAPYLAMQVSFIVQ
jgi:hypothetical protein